VAIFVFVFVFRRPACSIRPGAVRDNARKRARAKKKFGRRGSPRVGEAILDLEKKKFWPRSEALGATTPRDNTGFKQLGEVGPEHVAPVSGSPVDSAQPDSAPQSSVLPSSVRVSREHARSTAGKAGTRDLNP
jgi:hypothetical protein